MWPIFELRLTQNGFEQLERRILESVTLHVDVDKCAQFPGATKKRPELGANVGDRIGRCSRVDLRIKRRDFDRQIYNREKLYVSSERVRPVSRFPGQFLQ